MSNEQLILSKTPLDFQWKTLDPFLFCVHHQDLYPPGNAKLGVDPALLRGRRLGEDFTLKDGFRMYHGKMVPGFPGHPHVGFETITIVKQGFVDHSDSLGGAGRYGDGDVQWMTAGKGVQHSEMFPLLQNKNENPVELFQIWLNLPARNKKATPHFTMFWNEEIPRVKNEDGAEVLLVAGMYAGKTGLTPPPESWAADPANELLILDITLSENGFVDLPVAMGSVNRMIFNYSSSEIQVGEESLAGRTSAQLNANLSTRITAISGSAKILVLQAKPINEPVLQYGPFVATDEADLRESIALFQKTQFGGWPWPDYDHVHAADATRFAHFHDGTVVKK